MFVNLQDLNTDELVLGTVLPSNPRWGLRINSLVVGPYDSDETYEQHYLETIGSGDWYLAGNEEFRFDKTDNLLRSVWFHIPEVNIEEELIMVWRDLPLVEGLLRLIPSQEVNPEMGDFRYFEPNGRLLACVTEAALKDSKHRLKLRIAREFDLLFADNQFCGWLLSNPTDYLVYLWDTPCPIKVEDNSIALLVREYLTLVAEPYIEQMEEAEPKIREQLEKLHNKIDLNHRAVNQCRIIHDAITDILEKFY